jgi:hypothetical protein
MSETELLKRHQKAGKFEHLLHRLECGLSLRKPRMSKEDLQASLQIPERFNLHWMDEGASPIDKAGLGNQTFLSFLQEDPLDDGCMERGPQRGFNYISATCHILMLFREFEETVIRARNRLWVAAYEKAPVLLSGKGAYEKAFVTVSGRRAALTRLALEEQDDECLRLMAECFEEHRAGYMSLCYWGNKFEKKVYLGPGPDPDSRLITCIYPSF